MQTTHRSATTAKERSLSTPADVDKESITNEISTSSSSRRRSGEFHSMQQTEIRGGPSSLGDRSVHSKQQKISGDFITIVINPNDIISSTNEKLKYALDNNTTVGVKINTPEDIQDLIHFITHSEDRYLLQRLKIVVFDEFYHSGTKGIQRSLELIASLLELIANKNHVLTDLKLKGKTNIRKELKYQEESIKALYTQHNNLDVEDVLHAYRSHMIVLDIKNQLKIHEECLRFYQKLFPDNHADMASFWDSVGTCYQALGGEKNILDALFHYERSFRMRLDLFHANHFDIAISLNNVGTMYSYLGDKNKALEYYKQSCSILSQIDNLQNEAIETSKKTIIRNITCFLPEFFLKQGLRPILQEKDCLGGNKIGFECRWIISSRGEINDDLIKLKQKIQLILNDIVEAVNDYGWSNVGIIFGDWGAKGYMDKGYLRSQLGELSNTDKNVELAQMLCFEAINLGIMKSEKKPYEVVELFTQANPELVKKIAEQHPEFFIDGSIVEACVKAIPHDGLFQEHIWVHVKYMGMEERRISNNNLDGSWCLLSK